MNDCAYCMEIKFDIDNIMNGGIIMTDEPDIMQSIAIIINVIPDKKVNIYHGSTVAVRTPSLNHNANRRKSTDYGNGFYLTCDPIAAKEWGMSLHDAPPAFINKYSLRMNGLTTLDMSTLSIEEQVAILIQNRVFQNKELRKRGEEFVNANLHTNYKSYDIIVGDRCDACYKAMLEDFLSERIDLGQLEKALKLGDLGIQIFIQSQKALNQLTFVGVDLNNDTRYLRQYIQRVSNATREYEKIKSVIV